MRFLTGTRGETEIECAIRVEIDDLDDDACRANDSRITDLIPGLTVSLLGGGRSQA